uniref:Peptidase S1 domain-containing protein n=1 Tax=Steinernema glaseri TaxID=37863 RepID=A0A1I8A812_9BILA
MRLLLSLLLLFVAGPATAILPKIGFPKVDPNRFIPEPPEIPTTNEGFQALLNDTEFVFGGQLAQPGNFPYQVFFTYYKRDGNPYICGGSLISPTHVLTAAHCTIGVVAPARIMVGATNTRQQGAPAQWRNVQSINAHPYYRDGDPSFPNDIAILGFSPPVQIGGSVGLVRILADDSQLLSAGSAIISGFGTYACESQESSGHRDRRAKKERRKTAKAKKRKRKEQKAKTAKNENNNQN